MVARVAFRPLLRVLRRARANNQWTALKSLLKDRLFMKRSARNPGPPFLFQMASGYWLSQAVYVAAKLGIADLLESGPKSSGELAVATGCDPASLFRVLRALSSVGLVAQVDSRFTLADSGRALRSNVPGSLRRIAITLGEIHYQACGELLHSVRTGTPAFKRVFGADLFEYLLQNPEHRAAFDQGMTELAYLLAQAVLLAYDFSGVSTIVDVGGGEGELLRRILDVYPEMKGTVFELRERGSLSTTVEKAGRLSYISGNFLDAVTERAEAYVLCGVLHDWSDELVTVILQNCRNAMANNGRLLIVEAIMPEGNSPSFSSLLDINMMAMTSGRERTKSEFHTLLSHTDFRVNRIVPTLAPQSIIEAYPK